MNILLFLIKTTCNSGKYSFILYYLLDPILLDLNRNLKYKIHKHDVQENCIWSFFLFLSTSFFFFFFWAYWQCHSGLILWNRSLNYIYVNAGGLIWIVKWNSLQHPVASAFLAVLYSDYMIASGTETLYCSGKSYQPHDLRKFAISQVCIESPIV